jgi:predicted transcriptional regulator
MTPTRDRILTLAAQIVSAHVGNNDIPTDAVPQLIRDVYETLAELQPSAATGVSHDFHDHAGSDHAHHHHTGPAGQQTVFDDHLVCLEDGLKMKMLKRHLMTVHGLTPEEYREKWNLPPDYPMVASNYAQLRSSLAIQSGLGRRPEPVGRPRGRRY